MVHLLDPSDGGMSSRKFLFSIGTSVAVFGGALVAAIWPAFGPNYETLVGGLLGVLTLYLGGNITSKFAFAKQMAVAAAAADGKSDDKPDPEAK